MKIEFEEFLLKISEKRKCHSSLDLDKEKGILIMSFGDDENDNDVLVEFNMTQFKEHRKMINKVWDEMLDEHIDEEDHFGRC